MTYRWKTRSSTPGAHRFKAGTLTQLSIPANVRYGADCGDGSLGLCHVPTAAQTEFGVPVDVNDVGILGADTIIGQADPSDVRFNVIYGPTNNLVGTCHVPVAGSVALNIPVDDTVGIAVLTAADVAASVRTSGSFGQTVTVTSGTPAVPVQFASVQILDAADNSQIDSQIDIKPTDEYGVAIVRYNAGSVKIAVDKPGFASYTSAAITVVAAAQRAVTLTPITITPSADPLKVTGWVPLYSSVQQLRPGGKATLRQSRAVGQRGMSYAGTEATADANGIVSWPLIIGEEYQWKDEAATGLVNQWSEKFIAADDGATNAGPGTMLLTGVLGPA